MKTDRGGGFRSEEAMPEEFLTPHRCTGHRKEGWSATKCSPVSRTCSKGRVLNMPAR
jgi:hypothetical protein